MKNSDLLTIGPLAVIDAGAHSVRLEIVQYNSNGVLESLEELSNQVPLGRDVFIKGSIQAENINLTGQILRDYSDKMKEYGVKHCKAVATSAVREATNRDIFTNRVKQISGIELEILESPEEIRIILVAIKKALGKRYFKPGKNAVIAIIGTGSTHICFVNDGRLRSAESLRIGTLRIFEEIGQTLSPQKAKDIINSFISRAVTEVTKIHSREYGIDYLIAVGATVRTLAEIVKKGESGKMAEISRGDILSMLSRIAGVPPEKIAEEYSISDINAQSLEPSCDILENIIRSVGAKKILVPPISTRNALIDELLRNVRSEQDPFEPEIVSVAETIAEKYKVDLEHARAATTMALQIFDSLSELHGLHRRERLILHIASILQDIGHFVNSRQHHKHTCYLINSTPVAGIVPRELAVIAAVARYHRRGRPKSSHPEYMCLSPEDRVLVCKLAGILRIADALDSVQDLKARKLDISYDERKMTIAMKGNYDLTIEQLELKNRSDLFKDVFGRKVELE